MANRQSGVSKPGKRETDSGPKSDIYTHPLIAQRIANYLFPHYADLRGRRDLRVLDACANDGVLGNAIMDNCGVGELVLQDKKDSGKSILDYDFHANWFDLIVCNPPWHPVKLAEAIYHKLITGLVPDGILIFLIDITFCYQGVIRANSLTFQKFYFLPRHTFKSSGKDLLDCGVLVCHWDERVPEAAQRLDCFINVPKLTVDDWPGSVIQK